MSDDAAKDDKTTEDVTAKVDRPEDSIDADQQASTDPEQTAKIDADKTEKLAVTDESDKAEAEQVEPEKVESDKVEAAATADAEQAVKPETPAAASPAAAPYPPAQRSRTGQATAIVAAAVVAGVVLVAAVAVAAVYYMKANDSSDKLAARDDSTNAACAFGKQVGTYDAKSYDDWISKVKAQSTGDWLTQFSAASSSLKDITVQTQTRSTVSEIHCAWESGDNNSAKVDMLVTQSQSKAATPQSQDLTIGMIASMAKKDGKWLVSDVKSPMLNDLGGGGGAGLPGAGQPPAGDPQSGQAPAPGAPAPGSAPQPGN